MKNYRKWTAWLGAGAVILTIGAGCADKNDNGQPDSMATTEQIANTTKSGVDATENAADAMGNVASNVADTTTDAAGNVVTGAGNALENAADAATYTPKIKAAFGANAALAGSNINVDTKGAKNTIALNGTVKSSAQKTLAESIAKKNAPGFTITNKLVVGNGKM